MRFAILFLVLFVIGCQGKEVSSLGIATKYFPGEMYKDAGAVWKYYVHTYSRDGVRKTDIEYRKVTIESDRILLTDYRANFLEKYVESIEVDKDIWKAIATKSYDYYTDRDSLRTTNHYELTDENTYLNWADNEAKLNRSITTDRWENQISGQQNEVSDSTSNGLDIKIFKGAMESVFIRDGDTTINVINWQREFTEKLGMTYRLLTTDDFRKEWMLDEIISLEEFEKRADHGTHRVAYIDPEIAIDGNKDFETCHHISKIYDYYNDDRAQHNGGKGSLWEMLDDKLDKSLLKDQEGYLTYRFVVNCKGEAGRFVTEEADLDYNKIQFSDELRNHLLQMLIEENDWKSVLVRGEPGDAYAYVTFKIKNHEIIEILP